jgi:hypothetical protein
MEEPVERRKQRRFKVKLDAYAALGHRFSPVGQIMDISKGGLSFRYIASSDHSNGSSKLKILPTDAKFHFDMVPFKPIWDLAIPSEFSSGSMTMRQCGGQFGELRSDQKLELDHFIQDYTADEVEQ